MIDTDTLLSAAWQRKDKAAIKRLTALKIHNALLADVAATVAAADGLAERIEQRLRDAGFPVPGDDEK